MPDNVIGVWASHAQTFGGKVHVIPYGLQRVLSATDNRHSIIEGMIDYNLQPTKLMYINYSPGNHPVRSGLITKYSNTNWITVVMPTNSHLPRFRDYCIGIKSHKFMLCPSGNADGSECHRDWETIYMRRVPIVSDTPYHRAVFEPLECNVLYVQDLMHVTEQLLIDNDHLYQQAQTYDMHRLDYETIYNNIINSIQI